MSTRMIGLYARRSPARPAIAFGWTHFFAVALSGLLLGSSASHVGAAGFEASTGQHAPVRTPAVLELEPGSSRIFRPDQVAHTVVLGDPSVAVARIANPRAIAITGKSVGATNLILLNEDGGEISNTLIQVVSSVDLSGAAHPERRHEVRTLAFGAGEPRTRQYLCGRGCTPVTGPATPAR